jgi:hypothetical protein
MIYKERPLHLPYTINEKLGNRTTERKKERKIIMISNHFQIP